MPFVSASPAWITNFMLSPDGKGSVSPGFVTSAKPESVPETLSKRGPPPTLKVATIQNQSVEVFAKLAVCAPVEETLISSIPPEILPFAAVIKLLNPLPAVGVVFEETIPITNSLACVVAALAPDVGVLLVLNVDEAVLSKPADKMPEYSLAIIILFPEADPPVEIT